MRFLLVFAPLFLLIQPVENNDPPKTDNRSLKQLETDLELAESTAEIAKNELEAARNILEKNEADAKRLNEDYEQKKKDYERIDGAEKELEEASEQLNTLTEELKKAKDNVTEISKRETTLDEAQEELKQLEKTKPNKVDHDKLVEAQKNAEQKVKDQKKVVDGTKFVIKKCRDNCAKLKADLVEEERILNLATADLEKANSTLQQYEKNKIEYQPKHDTLTSRIEKLLKEVETVSTDLPAANAKVAELEEQKGPLLQRENYAKAAMEREETPSSVAFLYMRNSERDKKKADEELAKQKKVVEESKTKYDTENGKVEALKELRDSKKGGVVENAGFEWWPIVVGIVALLVVCGCAAGVVFLVRRKNTANVDAEKPDGPSVAPKQSTLTDSKSKDSKSKESKSKDSKSKTERSGNQTEKDSSSEQEAEYDPFNMPAGTSPRVREILSANAIPGTKAYKSREKIRFSCKCGQPCEIDARENYKCGLKGKDIAHRGPIIMKVEHPENHANDLENQPPALAKVDAIKVDPALCGSYVFGEGIERLEDMTIPKNPPPKDKAKAEKKKKTSQSKGTSARADKSDKSETKADKGGETTGGQCGVLTSGVGTEPEPENFDSQIDMHLSKLCRYEYVTNKVKQRYPFTKEFWVALCERASITFKAEDQLLTMSPPVAFVSDIHGQFSTLQRIFAMFAEGDRPGWTQIRWVFMGDYVDRGPQSLEVIACLFMLKIQNPKSFALLRGNHEVARTNKLYGFRDEVYKRFPGPDGPMLYDKINGVFALMSHGCHVAGIILCVHGGISPLLTDLDSLNSIPKPCNPDDFPLALQVEWSDPVEEARGWIPNARGAGCSFGEGELTPFMKKFGIGLFARGHQTMVNGSSFLWGHKMVTIFSSTIRSPFKWKSITSTMFMDARGLIGFKYLFQGVNSFADDSAKFIEMYDTGYKADVDYKHNQKEEELLKAAKSCSERSPPRTPAAVKGRPAV